MSNTIEEVFVIDILKNAVAAMEVQDPNASIGTFFEVNYEPGTPSQIIESMANKDKDPLNSLKYPLVASLMPISENNGSGFLEVSFPRIILAYLTVSGTGDEDVITKYDSTGVFKKILRPMERELIKQIAFSTYTSMGDPGAYEYTARQLPSRQRLGDGLNDFVEILEILNLKATIFPQIKTC